MTTNVFCFDRDLTVDVNFDTDEEMVPDDAEPVPLRWVIYLAHESEHHVWATGNQHLKREAQIPGVREAKYLWEEEFLEDAEAHYHDRGYYSYNPQRRDRLRLVKDIYDEKFPNADLDFYVIDDVYLGDMSEEGFTWYEPWDFREKVDNGEGPIEIPDDLNTPEVPLTSKDVEYGYCMNLQDLYFIDLAQKV